MEITRKIIEENINNPEILEDLYQSNKKIFPEIIKTMFEPESSLIIKYWYTRLFYKPAKKSNPKKYLFTALLVILTWIPIRLLSIDSLSFKENIFFINSIPIIFSVTLSLFFLFGSIKKIEKIALSIIPNIIVFFYIVLLEYIKSSQPYENESQSVNNAFIFMFILLWFFILFTCSNFNLRKLNYSSFLEKCGETIIWSTILIIGWLFIYTLSVALFNTIGIEAIDFYNKNILPLGFVASPFVSLLVIDNFNKVKLSVIVANIFLPLILISLIAFGITSIFTEAKPYEDRNIFIIYNVMMTIVISVLVFTSSNGITKKIIIICSYILPVVTVILDFVTISAVIYRLSKYGITANKITLLGTNLFMFGHLIYMIFLRIKHKIEQNTLYLPLYFLWAFIVVFIFPFIFKMA
jgi:hypothetical protein